VHTVIAGTQAPDIPEQSMLPFGQSARKYLQPPHILLILLFGRAQFFLIEERTPFGKRQYILGSSLLETCSIFIYCCRIVSDYIAELFFSFGGWTTGGWTTSS
jgi:hypothetical protein